jgi:ribosomal protein S12 methylthiotransferase accessory factor
MAGRTKTASETWSAIQPLLPDLGITRVGDITGLDRIGIPVWIAVRPNSRTLSVSQGKGLAAEAARVSAAMESIETALAERPRLALEFATVANLASREAVVDIRALPRPRVSLLGVKRPLFWTQATDWATKASLWVPYELVHADATLPWLPGSGAFLPSTNGLASGNNLLEAIHHGLCEVIERDALALWDHLPFALQERTRLDLRTIDSGVILGLLEEFSRASILATVWDMTSDIGVAAFRAVIYDESADALSRPFPAAFGAGCHPDRVVAIARALTEAAQSRLTVISGSRDDFGRARYAETQSSKALHYNRRLARAGNGARSFAAVAHWCGASLAEEIDYLAGRLALIGLDQILYLALGEPALPIAVARVIVPGLEGPTEAAQYYPGARVRHQLAAVTA